MKYNYKVLHFDISFFPKKGGSFYRLYNLIRPAQALAHIVVSNTLKGPEVYEGIRIFRVERSIRNIAKYYGIFFNVKPQAIVAHNSIIAIYLLPLLLFSQVHKIIEIHAIRKTGGLYDLINSLLYCKVFDTVSVLSFAMKRHLVDKYSVPEQKIVVVYNGYHADAPFSIPDVRQNLNPAHHKKRTIAYIGSLHEWQGVLDLLSAARILKKRGEDNVLIEFVGDGPLMEKMKDIISDHALHDVVKCHGHIEQAELADVVAKIDVLVIPRPSSVSTETIVPLKIFDYARYCRPVIMSDVGGLTEVLSPGTECQTYPAGDVEALANSIVKLVDNDQLMEALSVAALKKITSYNDWHSQAVKYEEVILSGIS